MDCYMYAMFTILIAIPWSESESTQTIPPTNQIISTSSLFHTNSLTDQSIYYTSETQQTNSPTYQSTSDLALKSKPASLHIDPTTSSMTSDTFKTALSTKTTGEFTSKATTDQSTSYTTSNSSLTTSLTHQATSNMISETHLTTQLTHQYLSCTKSESVLTTPLTLQPTSNSISESPLKPTLTYQYSSYTKSESTLTKPLILQSTANTISTSTIATLLTPQSCSNTISELQKTTPLKLLSTSHTISESSKTTPLTLHSTFNSISETQLTTQLTHQFTSKMISESPIKTPLTLQPTSNTVLISPLTAPFTLQSSTKMISESPKTTATSTQATSQKNQITSYASSETPIKTSTTEHIPPDTTSQIPPYSITSMNQINVTRNATPSPNEISTHSEVKRPSTTPDSKLSYSHALDTLEIVLPFKVEIKKTFKKELRNSNSVYYRNVSQEFKLKLIKQFRNTTGFSHINITGFSNGSIVCNYIAVYEKVQNITYFSRQFVAVRQSIQNTQFLGVKPESVEDMSAIVSKASKDLCQITRSCRPGFLCTSKEKEVECTNPCTVNPCKNKGECFYDIQTETSGCRCVPDDKYVYSGPQCTEQVESLALSSTQIIIICASSGGVVIIILFTVIVCLVIRRNRTLKQPGDRNQSRPSKMNDLYPDRWDNMPRSRENTVMNEYQSGLPDIALVDGREHMVLKSTHGNETYIYQPSLTKSRPASIISSEFETRSARAGSTYDYIDTEANYQIKRPSIKVGYLNQM